MSVLSPLWAPWRMEFIKSEPPSGCVFCQLFSEHASGSEIDRLTVRRGRQCGVVMNKYPYNSGHLMVMPLAHVAEFEQLSPEVSAELTLLIRESILTLKAIMKPGGINLGMNIGEAAGMGVKGHLHWHVVPRWNGDTNFMPVLSETKVISEHLRESCRRLREGWVDGNH